MTRALPWHVPGGLERHVEDLAVALRRAGCAVDILAAPLPPAECDRYAALGIGVHANRWARGGRYSLAYMLAAGRVVARAVARLRPDVVHGQEFALGGWRPGPGDPPLVLTVHGTITSETPLHPDVYRQLGPAARVAAWARFGRRFLYAPLWRRALAVARAVVVDSEFTRGELLRLGLARPERIVKVPLGTAQDDAAAPWPPRAAARAELGWSAQRGPCLMTVGRLEWQKGQALAIEVLAALRELEWHYVIAGEGHARGELEALIQRLGLTGRVELAGRVAPERKQAMLAAADLFVWPERTHPAFGLVGLEALWAGTPVLATRRGAIPEVLGEGPGRWLVEDCSAAALTGALEPLMKEPKILERARAELASDPAPPGRTAAQMAAETLDVYRRVLEGRDGGPLSP